MDVWRLDLGIDKGASIFKRVHGDLWRFVVFILDYTKESMIYKN